MRSTFAVAHEANEFEQFIDTSISGPSPPRTQSEPDVRADVEMGKQGAFLGHDADMTMLWRHIALARRHHVVTNHDGARVRSFEACDQSQHCCLATTRRTDHRHQGVIGDFDIDPVERRDRVTTAIDLGNPRELDARHRLRLKVEYVSSAVGIDAVTTSAIAYGAAAA